VFNWEKSIKDTILSSFFWGYVVLQIPAGMLAGRFGGKFLVFGAMACTGVVNLLVPLAANHVSFFLVFEIVAYKICLLNVLTATPLSCQIQVKSNKKLVL
jgi:fucose permease